MNYYEDPARSSEQLNFPSHLSLNNMLLKKKIKQPLKNIQANYNGFSVGQIHIDLSRDAFKYIYTTIGMVGCTFDVGIAH